MHSRLDHLDILKGVSILMLVAFHVCGQIYSSKPVWFRILSYQGVPAFFAASGFGLTYSLIRRHRGHQLQIAFWAAWMKKRLLRILPLYWLSILLTGIALVAGFRFLRLMSFATGTFYDFFMHALLLHLFTGKTYYSINPAWWFIGAIFYFYLIYPFLYSLFGISRFRGVGYLFVTILLLSLQSVWPSNSQIFVSFFFFATGVFLAFIEWHRIMHDRIFLYIGGLSVSVILTAVILYNTLLPGYSLLKAFNPGNILTSIFATAAIYFLSKLVVAVNRYRVGALIGRILKYYGDNSYAMFLIHWGFIYPIISAISNRFIGIIVYLVVVSAVSHLLTYSEKRANGFMATTR